VVDEHSIRKSFQRFVFLLKASGCIAVSGGLEVASDRLLKLEKGVTVASSKVTEILPKQVLWCMRI
jgi:hypothetical protein